jgi:hypothetical protein
LRTRSEESKKQFLDGVGRVVIRLRETSKEDKAEAVAAGSVEGQNALRIREIQALEASAAAAKRTADAMEEQAGELRIIRRCLLSLASDQSKSSGALAGIAVSMRPSCDLPVLTL